MANTVPWAISVPAVSADRRAGGIVMMGLPVRAIPATRREINVPVAPTTPSVMTKTFVLRIVVTLPPVASIRPLRVAAERMPIAPLDNFAGRANVVIRL